MTISLEDAETSKLIEKLKEKKITDWEYSEGNGKRFSNIFKTNFNEDYKVECIQTFAVFPCNMDDYQFGEYYIRVYDELGNNICESFNKLILDFYKSIKSRFKENEILKKTKIEESQKKKVEQFINFLYKFEDIS
jgi:hypothetical protein